MEYVVETTKIAWLTEISDWTAKKQDVFFFLNSVEAFVSSAVDLNLGFPFPGCGTSMRRGDTLQVCTCYKIVRK